MTTEPDRGEALSVGTVVAATYQVTRLLGRGGMGSVWEASHLRLPGKRVAIKVLHADVAADQEALARFRREAEIATRLGHPNIVEVHDFNSLPDGQPYLVLELLIGESLDSRVRRTPVSLDNAMRIAGQIGAALAAAHREQVVHRDLKPQNVFLVRPRVDEAEGGGELVKVLDFGISKIRGSQTIVTLDSTVLGTPQYMAPEQATGNHAAVDQRTDVFALGAIVYEMLSGRPVFTGQTIPEVVFKVVYEAPAPLADLVPGLPSRVVDAVERALAKKQDDRFPDVVSFVEQMAGVPLSTLRRAPLSFSSPAIEAMNTMDAAGEQSAADPLANTVDSGRREPVSQPADPEPLRTSGQRRPGRRIALAASVFVLALAAAGSVVLLVGNSSGRDGDETTPPSPVPTSRSASAFAPAPVPAPAPDPGPAADPHPEAEPGPARGPEPEPGRIPEPQPAGQRPAAATPRISPRVAKLRPGDVGERRDRAAEDRPETGTGTAPSDGDAGQAENRDESGPSDTPIQGDRHGALVDGERALRAGDYRLALALAERALRHGGGVAAHALRAAASCGIGDLGNAKASFLRIPRRNQTVRRRVLGFCATSGVELGP